MLTKSVTSSKLANPDGPNQPVPVTPNQPIRITPDQSTPITLVNEIIDNPDKPNPVNQFKPKPNPVYPILQNQSGPIDQGKLNLVNSGVIDSTNNVQLTHVQSNPSGRDPNKSGLNQFEATDNLNRLDSKGLGSTTALTTQLSMTLDSRDADTDDDHGPFQSVIDIVQSMFGNQVNQTRSSSPTSQTASTINVINLFTVPGLRPTTPSDAHEQSSSGTTSSATLGQSPNKTSAVPYQSQTTPSTVTELRPSTQNDSSLTAAFAVANQSRPSEVGINRMDHTSEQISHSNVSSKSNVSNGLSHISTLEIESSKMSNGVSGLSNMPTTVPEQIPPTSSGVDRSPSTPPATLDQGPTTLPDQNFPYPSSVLDQSPSIISTVLDQTQSTPSTVAVQSSPNPSSALDQGLSDVHDQSTPTIAPNQSPSGVQDHIQSTPSAVSEQNPHTTSSAFDQSQSTPTDKTSVAPNQSPTTILSDMDQSKSTPLTVPDQSPSMSSHDQSTPTTSAVPKQSFDTISGVLLGQSTTVQSEVSNPNPSISITFQSHILSSITTAIPKTSVASNQISDQQDKLDKILISSVSLDLSNAKTWRSNDSPETYSTTTPMSTDEKKANGPNSAKQNFASGDLINQKRTTALQTITPTHEVDGSSFVTVLTAQPTVSNETSMNPLTSPQTVLTSPLASLANNQGSKVSQASEIKDMLNKTELDSSSSTNFNLSDSGPQIEPAIPGNNNTKLSYLS